MHLFNRILIFSLSAVLAACSSDPLTVEHTPSRTEGALFEPVVADDFALTDHEGEFHRLFYYTNASAVVLFVHGNGCPISRNSIVRLKELRDQFSGHGVKFMMLNSNPQDTRESIAQEAAEFDIDFPILVDESQLVGESLGVKRTAEVFVFDPATRNLIYHGPVDDRLNYEAQKSEASEHYLADALYAHLNKNPVLAAAKPGAGCLVNMMADNDVPTYTDHAAPIMKAKCQQCHQAGGIAPWAMTGYEIVRGWAPMIREVIRTKRMPPWHADPHYGEFVDDLSLTEDETRTLVHWVEGGATRGEGEDILAEPIEQAADWPLGMPDMVVDLPEQELPATGVLDYVYHDVDIPLEEDVWLKGIDIKPGNNAVVHHVLMSIDYPETYEPPKYVVDFPTHVVMYMKATGGDIDKLRWVFGIAGGYVPGTPSRFFPENTGRILPKGSSLKVQVHYTTTGRQEVDASQFGLYFQEPAEREVFALSAVNFEMKVPPHAEHHELTAKYIMEEEGTIYDFIPHMHYRGKSMNYEAHYPDGRVETLLSVPNYDFNWQRTYTFEKPLQVPAGTMILVNAVFDNSSQNIHNPDPEAELYFGEQTYEEMLIGYFSAAFGPGESEPVITAQKSDRPAN